MLSDKIISRIRHLRRRGWREGAQLEFKSAQGGIPRSMWETYSAFANTQGGFIILGVEDNGNIKGLPHPEKYRDDLFNQLNNAQRCSINLCSNEHIRIMESEKKQILVLYVPQAKPQHRPVFLNGNEANCFMRDGSGDRRCTPEEIRRMRRNRDVVESQTSSHDSILIPYSSFDDVDYESLQRFRRRMLTTQMGATWIDLDDLSLLRRLGGYRKDCETGQEGLTLAGLLMFGRSESLHELRPYYRVDYFEYDNSTDISDRWIDRISNDGTWSGNLFDFFFRVYPKLQQGIKRPFRLNDDMTRQEETPADIALREALANAIIHADYYESFGIRIDNRPNGLFFTNPGSLLIPRARLLDGSIHPSICRNKSLQLMFQTLGIGDQAGSGIDKIVKGWLDGCVSLPDVQELQEPCRVQWSLPYYNLVSKENVQRVIRNIGADLFADLDFNDKRILVCSSGDTPVAHKDLAPLLSIHSAELSKRLSRLVTAGLLRIQGHGRGATYVPAELPHPISEDEMAYLKEEPNVQPQESVMSNLDAQCPTSIKPNSTSNGLMSDLRKPNIQPQESVMSNLDAQCPTLIKPNSDSNGLMSDLRTTYPPEVERARSRSRISKKEMQRAIMILCRDNWCTIASLACILKRERRSISRYCDELTMTYHLEMQYKDNIHHPMQAYRTISRENVIQTLHRDGNETTQP